MISPDDLENKGKAADNKNKSPSSITVLLNLFFVVFLFTSATIYSFLLILLWLSGQDLYASPGFLFLCYSPICGVFFTAIAFFLFRELTAQDRRQKILALSVVTAIGSNVFILIISYWVKWKDLVRVTNLSDLGLYIPGVAAGIISLVVGWAVYYSLNQKF